MIKFRKIVEEAIIPTLGTEGSAGYDLYSTETATLYGNSRKLYRTGIGTKFDKNIGGQIWPRSGLALKHGIGVTAAKIYDDNRIRLAGLIDSDYPGEIGVVLYNHSNVDYEVKSGDRIAQICFVPIVHAEGAGSDDAREGGYGSTGA